VTSKPATIGTFDIGTSLQVPRHQQIVTIETEAELCCGNPARWSTRLKFVQICGALVALRPTILASEWVAARIGPSEMGEGPSKSHATQDPANQAATGPAGPRSGPDTTHLPFWERSRAPQGQARARQASQASRGVSAYLA
jgi:hypothetical protein